MYPDMVNAMRAEIIPEVEFICAKATAVSTSGERQQVRVSTGEEISCRLVILANGLNIALRSNLGIEREVMSACHSISIGFDLKPRGRQAFDFPALTYYSERIAERIAYLTLFRVRPAVSRGQDRTDFPS